MEAIILQKYFVTYNCFLSSSNFRNLKTQGLVPGRTIRANLGFKFCSVFVLYLPKVLPVTFCDIITVSRSNGSTVVCKLELLGRRENLA